MVLRIAYRLIERRCLATMEIDRLCAPSPRPSPLIDFSGAAATSPLRFLEQLAALLEMLSRRLGQPLPRGGGQGINAAACASPVPQDFRH
jgi:hypothetical protein